ncbi:NAD-dependent succinate-semialdehyde dehydrogenase [Legionella sp. CNM-4043-24]|uniref:NAD-dependent succinate-semialdehyde dehydrogenase n=1 Tax=Legionella sp. CNM-4043-24 TaxID=3421646 RepID=UPI00403ABBF0
MMIHTTNPATGAVLHKYPELSEADARLAVEQGHRAFLAWKSTSFAERSRLMLRVSELLLERSKELRLLIAREMGKPVSQGQKEIEKCAWVCRHYAAEAEAYLEPRMITTEMSKAMVCYQPLGVVFAIMPWNFPAWQVFRFLAPTLMAGNAAILKHAPNCYGTGQAIASLLSEAGFPVHLFQHTALSNETAASVLAHPDIVGLSFTGSGKTGRLLSSLASAHLKKSLLELGGSDPYLILDDADIDLAAERVVSSRLSNCGQVCISAKRIIANVSIYDQLVDKIIQLMSGYVMGDPENMSTSLGPMARGDLRSLLHSQVEASIARGAQLVLGGKIPEGPGFYYPPTLLTNVRPGMPAFDEELFGPVLSVIKAADEKDALQLANQSPYGLAAAVFTRDEIKGESIALQINAGTCFVNESVSSDPRVPFGGIKQSGFGRELSREGILEFVNTKTICVK